MSAPGDISYQNAPIEPSQLSDFRLLETSDNFSSFTELPRVPLPVIFYGHFLWSILSSTICLGQWARAGEFVLQVFIKNALDHPLITDERRVSFQKKPGGVHGPSVLNLAVMAAWRHAHCTATRALHLTLLWNVPDGTTRLFPVMFPKTVQVRRPRDVQSLPTDQWNEFDESDKDVSRFLVA